MSKTRKEFYRRLLFIPVLMLLLSNAFSQDSVKVGKKIRIEEVMAGEIKTLKEGVLIFILQTKENSINALLQRNDTAKANKVRREQEEANKKLIESFDVNFNFCPVYFIYSKNAEALRNKKFGELVFLNENLQPDKTISLDGKKYLIGDIGTLESDTTRYYSHNYLDQTANGPVRKDAYNSGPSLNFTAIRILSEQFVQLQNPFPYYVKVPVDYSVSERFIKPVKKLNKRLADYYKECYP